MSSAPWFKFYIGDFLQDTASLHHLERSIYLLLLCEYYSQGGPFEDDKERIAAQCNARTAAERKAMGYVLNRYFTLCDGHWWNPRADQELSKRRVQSDNGKKGGRGNLRVAKA